MADIKAAIEALKSAVTVLKVFNLVFIRRIHEVFDVPYWWMISSLSARELKEMSYT
jgi:hypothetical protein